MSKISKARRLQLSINSLFNAPRGNTTRINRPNDYFGNYYFAKNICDGIELIAEYERVTKKAVANKLMAEGLRQYMAGLLRQFDEQRMQGPPPPTEKHRETQEQRFKRIMKRRSRENGQDVDKLF
jgi:hypothetical protein